MRTSGRRGMLVAACVLWTAAWMAPACPAQPKVTEGTAQDASADESPFPEPAPSSALLLLMSADYLNDDERADLAVRHGLWEPEHLADATRSARAALTRGCFTDEEFNNADVPIELRAAAERGRGRPERAIELLEGVQSVAGVLARAEALMDLGRYADAQSAAEPLAQRLAAGGEGDPDTIVDCVKATMIVLSIKGPVSPDGGEYRALIQELGRVRTQLEPLSWAACLAEAELLFAKSNYAEAGKALEESLKLNPRNAASWELLGDVMVNSLNVDGARRVAARLDVLAAPALSPGAAIIRSRAEVRQSRWAEARAALEPALAAYPTHRGLLAAKCAALAGTFDMGLIRRELAGFDALSTGSADALLAVGKAMSEARQYPEAAELLGEAARRRPGWIEPLIELGLVELQAGRLDEAEVALVGASKLDTFNTRAENSRKLLDELKTFKSFENEHFIVRCKPGIDEIVASEMLVPLERIYARVTGDRAGGIDHKPAGKTVVELYPTHRWFAARITGMTGIHTIAAATGPVIAMERPAEGAGHPMGVYDWARVVQHEFTHTVTLSRTKNRLPHWFTEASAVYLEDAPRDWSTVTLLRGAYEADALFDFESINLAFARPKRPSDRSLAYAQGHWMYEYIIERWGPRSVLDLMDLYAKGTSEADAFNAVLKVSREDFLRDFKVWAGEQLVAWGVKSKPGTPTSEDLLKDKGADAASVTDAVLDELIASNPANPDLLKVKIKRGLDAAAEGYEAALEPLLLEYAALRPVDPLPHQTLARFYLDGKVKAAKPGAAIPHLEYLDAREQSSPAFALELAAQYATLGEMDKATAKAARATQISPYDARTRERAAAIFVRANDLASAERNIRALIAIEPDREIHKQRLDALLKRKNP
ncbi:MAG: peptidase MA family metallohydrolase [Phycisphaerales bacterium]